MYSCLAFLKYKTMKSYIFTSVFLMLFCVSLNAQNGTNVSRLSKNDWSSILRGNQALATKKRDDIELRGSPFIKDEWLKGAVIVSDSLFSENNHSFKLDVAEHEIWIQADNKDPMILTDARITGLDLKVGDTTLNFRKWLIPSDGKNMARFVQVLFKGNRFALCKYVQKEFVPSNYVDKGVAVVGRNYDFYETAIAYYTLNDKKQLRKVNLKRGDLFKLDNALVEKNREAIDAFCKENAISNPLDEEDAVDLVRFLDNLK